MNNAHLWSLRLGFSGKQASEIKKEGIKAFLQKSFAAPLPTDEPPLINKMPKTVEEYEALKKKMSLTEESRMEARKNYDDGVIDIKTWWIEKMDTSSYPLREKLVLFWHNHFVASSNITYRNYQHNQLLRVEAFSNFRELTKKAIQTNAQIQYLDNNRNRKGNYNENLSRELLELFTLGIGNYSEQDIKNGAKGLAGLTAGDDKGHYIKAKENNEPFIYFGKTGNFKADEMVDIIFEQKNAPYLITSKILKWFIYDNPPQDLVLYYGNYLREVDYEMKPFLIKIFTEEYDKPTEGSKIKDPLVYILQIINELGYKNIDYKLVHVFLKSQNMDLYNQLNVKGWEGGKSWITAQLFMQRNLVADRLCKGRLQNNNISKSAQTEKGYELKPKLIYETHNGNTGVIESLKNRLLFATDDTLEESFKTILPYDFDPKSQGAENGVLRLFNFIVKTPEFQLI
ncbi:DUF1800 family protein [Flavobacterium sp. RHBU_24]|uniref:DUF1800 family protein n=1 Tax=Flavobacterium sp. RHBU_24 TaxID=3391185 RepID=UPI0039851669